VAGAIKTPATNAVSAPHVLFGAWVQQGSATTHADPVRSLEAQLGFPLAIDNTPARGEHRPRGRRRESAGKQGPRALRLRDGPAQERAALSRHACAVHRGVAARLRDVPGPRRHERGASSGRRSPPTSKTASRRASIPATATSTGSAPTDTTGTRAGRGRSGQHSVTSSPPSTPGRPRAGNR
jgi:hypothetical protein